MRKPLILVWVFIVIAANASDNTNIDNDIIFDEGPPSESELPFYRRILNRVKRGLFDFNFFEDKTESPETTSTTTEAPKPTTEESPTSPSLSVTTNDVSSRHTRAPEDEELGIPLKGFTSDDEDGHLEDSSGSGETPGVIPDFSPTVESYNSRQRPALYRMSLIVEEPYTDDFKDESTDRFQMFASKLEEDINSHYKPLPGEQTSHVRKIENNGTFFVLATVDLESEGNANKNQLKDHMLNALENNRIGNYVVKREGFTFNRFRDCDENEIICTNSEICISASLRCDGTNDCPDNEDEIGCVFSTMSNVPPPPPGCRDDEFMCDEPPRCILLKQVCDRILNCADGKDEYPINPDCQKTVCSNPYDVQCRNGTCLSYMKKCDLIKDCPDGEDEEGCLCNPNLEFSCDGKCVLNEARCDGNQDCRDGSDERNCTTKPSECFHGEFRCNDGVCINSDYLCDKIRDCNDGSDEVNCNYSRCASTEFDCGNNTCIPISAKCNGPRDCANGLDEIDCRPTCAPFEFHCHSGECISSENLCDGIPHCKDNSDEGPTCGGSYYQLPQVKIYGQEQIIKEGREAVFQCRDEGPTRYRVKWSREHGLPFPTGYRDYQGRLELPNVQREHSGIYYCEAIGAPPNLAGAKDSANLTVEQFILPTSPPGTVCAPDEATCDNHCIYKYQVCDGVTNCMDGSDEDRCLRPCEPNEFRCNNTKCILKTWQCDKLDDCGDNSDEIGCGEYQPGSQCLKSEFECSSKNQCTPKTYQCDGAYDCMDHSDEFDCRPVTIDVTLIDPNVELCRGETLVLKCQAIGNPVPHISWRRNWKHVPAKCSQTSDNGFGTLTCPDATYEDSGAYTCEAITAHNYTISPRDTIVVIKKCDVCGPSTFNDEATSPEECIPCFCFGQSTVCRSADLYVYQLPPPIDGLTIVNVYISPTRIDVNDNALSSSLQSTLRRTPDSVITNYWKQDNVIEDLDLYPYYALSEKYHGAHLKSYGGYLRYTIEVDGVDPSINIPDIIVMGNDRVLIYRHPHRILDNIPNEISARFFEGVGWSLLTPSGEVPALRRDIMMTLLNVENILLRIYYSSNQGASTTLTRFTFDSAKYTNANLGKANFVEECQCPPGFDGLSCEHRLECPAGHYRRGSECVKCPCPLTTPPNQFSQECYLDSSNAVKCRCPPGYRGDRCQFCEEGYEGNPMLPGDYCRPKPRCDPSGTQNFLPDGQCECKAFTTGTFCSECLPNTFGLARNNQYGCIDCFCGGLTRNCTSSRLYRNEIQSTFVRSNEGIKIGPEDNILQPNEPYIRDGMIYYDNFEPKVYYWVLPDQYLKNQLTAYGGSLTYKLSYEPFPGGLSSRNNAADVKLFSRNRVNLYYYHNATVVPNQELTISIPILEEYWQREDGGISNRAQLLMALADVDAILIKATYTTSTSRASLHFVSLEVANPSYTGSRIAQEVEECDCPEGYKGLSCESCKEGYKKSTEGLYFGTCELCECNGRSETCDPESGACSNCRDNWTGPRCEYCRPGYTEQNGRCVTDRCDCEQSGVVRPDCPYGYCECKQNVEGSRCDLCKEGSFFLTPNNPQGCSSCYCSGVTSSCQSSNLYYELSPLPFLNASSNNGIVLTNRLGEPLVIDNFIVTPARNEIGFEINPLWNEYFWALPTQFTGDKITSYGGKLIFTRRFVLGRYGNIQSDPDVILYGKGKYIYWQNNVPQRSPEIEIIENVEVTLKEGEWKLLDPHTGHASVTRPDFLDILSDLKSILIRASSGPDIVRTYLSDVAMDVAISQRGGTNRALGVESCNCPPGYEGTSCQKCRNHYYRGEDNRCHQCDCYNNEESCHWDSSTREVQCVCKQEYEGRQCRDRIVNKPNEVTDIPPIEIKIIESEPSILIKTVGSTVRYTCTGISKIPGTPVSLIWSKYGGTLPRDRARDDFQGNLEIVELRESDSGIYVCTAFDGNTSLTQTVSLKVGGNEIAPTIYIDPSRVDVYEYQPAEIRCTARGSPLPSVQWHRIDNGTLNLNATIRDGNLLIPYTLKSDEGTYECIARNRVGSMTGTAYISVLSVIPYPRSYISPENSQVQIGEALTLSCYFAGTTYDSEYDWRRDDGRSHSGRISGNTLVFTQIRYEDAGRYICIIRNRLTGEVIGRPSATITIFQENSISGSVVPDFQVVPQGQVAEFVCNLPFGNYPGQDKVVWYKTDGPISPRAQYLDNGRTLRIPGLEINDRGVYVCSSEYGGRSANPARLEVTRREAPTLELDPRGDRHVLLVGESLALDCRVDGFPAPTVKWTKAGNSFFSNNLVLSRSNTRLTFNQVALSDAGEYTCTAENVVGEASASTYIEIQAPPEVRVYPSDSVSLRAGDNLDLTCEADGSPTPKVRWTKRNPTSGYPYDNFNLDNEIISNPNDRRAEYRVMKVSLEDEGYYFCIAENSARREVKVVQVTVEDYGTPPYPPPDQSTYSTIPAGGNTEIICSIDTDRNIDRHWIRTDRNPFPASVYQRDGILYIRSATRDVDGEYACVTYDSGGNVEQRISRIIKVIELPEIFLYPVRQIVRPGDNAQIICNASGPEPITITWEANRPQSHHVQISGNILRFEGITENDEGRYICKARNSAGLREAAADVIVNDLAPRVAVVGSKSRTSIQGSSLTLQCESDYPNNITWTFTGGLPSNAIIEGNTLSIRNLDPYLNSGRYTCTAFSPSGSYNSDYIQLTVTRERACIGGFLCSSGECINFDDYCNNSTDCADGSDEADCQRIRRGAVHIRLKIEPSIDIIRVGSTVDLRCITEGIPSSKIEWTKLNEPSLGPNVQTISASVLRIVDVTTSNAGPYRCSAQTETGKYTDEFVLNVQDNYLTTSAPPPAAKTIHLKAGDTVDINCLNDLEPPVSYTWLKQGGLPSTATEEEGKLTLNKITIKDAGLYTCIATNGEVKMEIPTFIVVEGTIPRFTSDSYIKLKTLFDAYMQFDIEILFKPEEPHGLILYNGHHASSIGGKDFVSFGLRNGFPEFKFDMGSGHASIVGRSPLPMGKWTKAKLHRNRKEGQLIINEEDPVIGTSQGRHQGLDLDLPLYVGSVPDFNNISKSADFNSGFTGCISRLVIKNEEQNLTRRGSLEWVGISECENCAGNTCTNSGACQEAPNRRGYICLCPRGFSGENCDRTGESCYPGLCGDGYCENTQKGYVCKCPLGLTGDNCEHRIKIRTPSFDDKSYMAYTAPKDTGKIDISIKLNPSDSRDALILYAAQNDFGTGNYMSLTIKDRRFEFRFDTGAGAPMVLRSNSEVIPGTWVTITAGRDTREARLSAGNGVARTTLTSGQRRELLLGTFLYLGGFDFSTGSVNQNVGVFDGFRGCISHIDISRMDIDILRSQKESSNIGECPSGNPCRESPCQNGASCIPDGGSYSCACTPDYSGPNCEKLKNVCERHEPCGGKGECIPFLHGYKCRCVKGFSGQNCTIREHFTTSFSVEGDGWVELPRSILADVGDVTEIEMSIVTNAPDGILLWHGQDPATAGGVTDFFSIAVVSGHVEVVFELGSGVGSVVEHDIRVDDGITHRIHAVRKGNYAVLTVDHKLSEGASDGFLSKLNANGNIYIGGLPDPSFMTNGRYLENFNGCIQNVVIQNSDVIDVSHMAISTVNVRRCPVPAE